MLDRKAVEYKAVEYAIFCKFLGRISPGLKKTISIEGPSIEAGDGELTLLKAPKDHFKADPKMFLAESLQARALQ